MINDSIFIHFDWENFGYNKTYLYYSGRGKIENDSIFLDYIWGDIKSYPLESCNCKGVKKVVHIPPIEPTPTKAYYNPITQEIIIDAGLQNQPLTLELYNIQGKMLLREINVGNSISIAHLPQGVYVYRLLQGNQMVCRGKVLK